MEEQESSNKKPHFLILVIFLLGVFILGIGLGLMFFEKRGQDGDVAILAGKEASSSVVSIHSTNPKASGSATDQTAEIGKVNVNSASFDELDTLPGIGPVTAKKIVSLRPYASVDDLLAKKAVTKSVFSKIKGLVTF